MKGRSRTSEIVAGPQGEEGTETGGTGLCRCDLDAQNSAYGGTGGVSEHNRHAGFLPAYQNTVTGETVLSRFVDGSPAPVHILDGLPSDWVAARDPAGHVSSTRGAIVAGFVRDGTFYTRAAAARLVATDATDREP